MTDVTQPRDPSLKPTNTQQAAFSGPQRPADPQSDNQLFPIVKDSALDIGGSTDESGNVNGLDLSHNALIDGVTSIRVGSLVVS